MRYPAVICILLASLTGAAAAQQAITHEEATVRATYARLAYAAQMGVLLHGALDANVGRKSILDDPAALKREMDSQLAFQLQSINVGTLADIGDTKWETLVTKPQLDLVSVAFNYQKVAMKAGTDTPFAAMSYVFANWERWDGNEMDWSALTVGNHVKGILANNKPAVWSRYAANTVTVTLAGRQRTYQSIFLFGKDSDGNEVVYPIDHVLGMEVLNETTDRSLYPQPLVETDLRELPAIANWLSTAGVLDKCPPKLVCKPVTAPDVMCDGTGKCGIPASVLRSGLKVPIDPDIRKLHQGFRNNPRSKTQKSPNVYNTYQPVAAESSAGESSDTASCSNSNTSFTPTETLFGTADHSGTTSGNEHIVNQSFLGTCMYTNPPASQQYCNSEAEVSATLAISTHLDEGKTISGNCHVVALNSNGGSSSTTNGGASASGAAYGAAQECAADTACDCSISLSAGGLISSSGGTTIWGPASNAVTETCAPVPNPQYVPPPPLNGCCLTPSICNPKNPPPGNGPPPASSPLACVTGATGCTCQPTSPIIIDTAGRGFHLTDAADGVMFDFFADGRPIKMAWTSADSGDAFLALPHDGAIRTGKDLFGNITPQPESAHPNGFLALAEYDKIENGGNADGIIDWHDSVFTRLRLWVDANHDGIAQANELFTLPELGVYSISLKATDDTHEDQYGNQFHYKAVLNPNPLDGTSRDGRWTYDIFFVVEPRKPVACPAQKPNFTFTLKEPPII